MESIEQLKQFYQKSNCFGLYLGAGINLFPPEWKDIHKKSYKTYTWEQLLEALYEKNKKRLTQSFKELLKKHKNDWPGLASEIVGSTKTNKFVKQMDSIIYKRIPRKDKHGRLCKGILNQSPTLHAIICFSAEIKKKTSSSWTFKRNEKIKIVVTPNFDFFFGAGLSCYRAFKRLWKVHTPFSQRDTAPQKVTINYIHGYIPYRLDRKEELVLKKEMYKKHYASGEFAERVTREAINNYDLIFVGTSFNDDHLFKILQNYKGNRRHFAIVKSETPAAEKAKQLNLCTIEVEYYSQIVSVLKEIYCAALTSKKCHDVSITNPEEYWQRLEKGPVTSHVKSQ